METIVGALIGASFALGGIWFEKRSQAKADEKRWDREEARRRRIRGEEVAREARRALLEAAALFEASWVRASGRAVNWESPPGELVGKLTERALDSSIEVPDDGVRLFVRNAVSALAFADDANEAGGPPPWTLARSVAAETDAVIGAYLRGERLPPAAEVETAVAAAGEWQAQMDAYYAERQAEWQQRRAGKAKAEAEVEATPTPLV